MKKIVIGALCAFAISAASAQNVPSSSALSISETQVGPGASGVQSIIGIATNTSGAPLHGAVVKFNLYDSQGSLVGNTIAVVTSVDAGGRWRFEAPIIYQTAATYKLVEVNAY